MVAGGGRRQAATVVAEAEPRNLSRGGGVKRCQGLARPNVLMFGDTDWIETRADAQQARMREWLTAVDDEGARLVIVECGAGTGIPTVRLTGEGLARRPGATLVRINLREAYGPAGALGITAGAREALERLHQGLSDRGLS